jgi:hypothetical protein
MESNFDAILLKSTFILSELCISLTGLPGPERVDLQSLIQRLGATYSPELHRHVSILLISAQFQFPTDNLSGIISKDGPSETSFSLAHIESSLKPFPKILAALKWGIDVVTTDWIQDCNKQKKRLAWSPYIPSWFKQLQQWVHFDQVAPLKPRLPSKLKRLSAPKKSRSLLVFSSTDSESEPETSKLPPAPHSSVPSISDLTSSGTLREYHQDGVEKAPFTTTNHAFDPSRAHYREDTKWSFDVFSSSSQQAKRSLKKSSSDGSVAGPVKLFHQCGFYLESMRDTTYYSQISATLKSFGAVLLEDLSDKKAHRKLNRLYQVTPLNL